ncbi:hypothetical protein CKAN_00854600 [Cinnamomum micranthum f. kanehirae]|uniref:Uncharacterized protein n=1 Tax=Cinnamomum micranthum f. kanehirae TaxID=337451 RepID=A0A443NN42_9MAGN|nr:hypothetical protein CKAN_00854600 [Cinnamomum micranthum f. kanehirae]
MEVRQRTTLSDQMAISNSPNLRDLLKLREENERRDTLTLGSILDIIRDEEGSSSSGAYTTIITTTSTTTTNNNNRTSWKFFRNRRIRRSAAAAAWISAGLVDSRSTADIAPTDDAAARDSDQIGSPEAERTDLAAALAAERRQQLQRREVGDVSPARVSLMALLEETDTCPGVICWRGRGGRGVGEGERERGLRVLRVHGKEEGSGVHTVRAHVLQGVLAGALDQQGKLPSLQRFYSGNS